MTELATNVLYYGDIQTLRRYLPELPDSSLTMPLESRFELNGGSRYSISRSRP